MKRPKARDVPDVTTDLIVESGDWDAAALAPLAQAATEAALTGAGLSAGAWQVSVMACDDARIAALNAEFRGKPAPTNVLSWPAQPLAPPAPGEVPPAPEPDPFEEATELGDIALADGVCRHEARDQGKTFEAHVSHLIVHAVLHLLGYDHETEQDAALMEALERKVLGQMGIEDPYAWGIE